ncbi:uncharacterized protein A1O9_11096 [Exophiala aquamarina CBS 119918]|uniref:Uncharacterized protein n=1 Tax=Exophiala aquamarina CBS 119918 TaxID=1182545 RepID=A0A072NXR8_9EURO|nr:uncharacterized protein A1O9_11096 [Exophiala aquamarina CBS 119918]KEF52679.1 hypothetical protein A1O9_11096 [Exophiala aquamarina CBS 119918]
MARKSRRQVANDDSDGDEDYNQPPMSPNTQRTYNAQLTMEASHPLSSLHSRRLTSLQQDLGNATAEFITTSDYHRHERSRLTITRRSDIAGTAESKKAAAAKEELRKWRMYSLTEDAISTTVGAKEPVGSGNGNAHRARLQADLQASSHSLMDPSERDSSHARSAIDNCYKVTRARVQSIPASTCVANPVQKSTEKQRKVRSRATQDRPWPPPALIGTAPFTPQPEPSQAHRVSKSNAAAPAIDSSKSKLADPKDFMSFFNSLNAPNTANPTPAQDKPSLIENKFSSPAEVTFSTAAEITVSTPAEANPFSPAVKHSPTAHAAAKAPTSARASKPQETATHPLSACADHNEIRKVPVEEFSFPLSNTLAPGEVATHTDGAPSPDTLSGFSDSGSATGSCIGIRASSKATRSPVPPNIMDSPILDDVSGIAVMRGQEWVPKSQFKVLQAEFEAIKKELAELKLKQSLATVAATPRVSFSMPTAGEHIVAPVLELKHSRQVPSENVPLATSIYAASPSPTTQLGLGISITQLLAAPKPSVKSPDLVSAVLKPISTNGGSIFGDSRVIRPGATHVITTSTDLLTEPTLKRASKPLTRRSAGPGFKQLVKDLGQLPSGGQPAPSRSGLKFVNSGYLPRGPGLESDEEL